ncbi:MAG: two-component sensor histidine kinase [Phycisphaerae bacterium]|nr:two-component sensor histidine kinase [Phycisphaerae bacterium]
MHPLMWFFLGLLVGSLAGTYVLRTRSRRQLARARAAERRARSAERLAELGSMTGGLAHEIKNPLSTIGLNAQLLEEGIEELSGEPEAKSRLARRVASLRREVERLRGILSDFLEYAGELRIEARPADLNAVVDELVDFFLPQCEQQGVRLRAELASEKLTADLDVPHAKQAILNLMLNAVQAMTQGVPRSGETGGDAATSAPPRELILRTRRVTDADKLPAVALHVIDTGPGIDADSREKIFHPYFTTKAGGTGLGLPTTRRIVEAHHGRIEVHSEPGRGSDFTLIFPASDGAAATN